MIETIDKHRQDFDSRIRSTSTSEPLKQLRIDFLGKKGCVQALMKELRQATPEEKRQRGKLINDFKQYVENQLKDKEEELGKYPKRRPSKSETFDTTLPGRREISGTLHPITQVMEEINSIFLGLGFQVEEGPEIETDYYNFEALNIPKDHPARDMQDTFWVTGGLLLRSHTTTVQARVLESKPELPIRIASAGRVYRNEAVDATHLAMFHQLEGLWIDKGLTFANLKGLLSFIAKSLYGEGRIRFKPNHEAA